MPLLLRLKKYARTFGTYFGWYGHCAFNLKGHLICSAESCCTWLYFELMIFIDLAEKFSAKT